MDGTIAAKSTALKENGSSTSLTLHYQLTPNIYKVNDRYWITCGVSLQVKGKMLGKVYVARDITSDRAMFLSLVRTLGIASILSLGAITVAIEVR